MKGYTQDQIELVRPLYKVIQRRLKKSTRGLINKSGYSGYFSFGHWLNQKEKQGTLKPLVKMKELVKNNNAS